MHTHSQVIMAKMATRKQQRPSLKVTVPRRTTPRLNVLSLSLSDQFKVVGAKSSSTANKSFT